MSYQVREYFCNGQSILPDRYEEVEKAKHDQEIDALNSMGSGMYQSSRGNNFNQTGNQFQDSTGSIIMVKILIVPIQIPI